MLRAVRRASNRARVQHPWRPLVASGLQVSGGTRTSGWGEAPPAAAAASAGRPFSSTSGAAAPAVLKVAENSGTTLMPKLLIANRGEIACRIAETAKRLNVRTVAVYSEADAHMMHVQAADEAYCIGPAASRDSYLRGDRLLELCKITGATAIHPGYGFLSENANFVRDCEAAGVTFVGPPVPAIDAMGSKSASKDIMTKAGVALVPGYHGLADQSDARLQAEAEKMEFPVLIKAVMGGGGKGMRIVKNPQEFNEMLQSARAEARSSFGDDRVLVEKYITRPRHVEVQVFADKHGNVVSLFERDCSVQRRHQKVIEEAPAPNLRPGLREELHKMARDAARAVGYVGAGTVEFIMDVDSQKFWFMEMNTRLQVEHPISEMITGVDLVEWQLRIAAGEKLPLTQDEINARVRGWAFESRIYAENPRNNFLPGTGKIVKMTTPQATFKVGDLAGLSKVDRSQNAASGIRIDTGVREGDEISIYYDPMIAKLVTWDVDRASALRRMKRALEEWNVVGLQTNVDFLHALTRHPKFESGDVETGFIEKYRSDLLPELTSSRDAQTLASVAFLLLKQEHIRKTEVPKGNWTDPWSSASDVSHGFRVNSKFETSVKMTHDDDKIEIRATYTDDGFDLKFSDNSVVSVSRCQLLGDGSEVDLFVTEAPMNDRGVAPRGRRLTARVVHHDDDVYVFLGGETFRFDLPAMKFGGSSSGGAGSLLSPMPGKITAVLVKVGDRVEAGQALMKMEAMKMEHTIRAPVAGVVEEIRYREGDLVVEKKQLASIAADEA